MNFVLYREATRHDFNTFSIQFYSATLHKTTRTDKTLFTFLLHQKKHNCHFEWITQCNEVICIEKQHVIPSNCSRYNFIPLRFIKPLELTISYLYSYLQIKHNCLFEWITQWNGVICIEKQQVVLLNRSRYNFIPLSSIKPLELTKHFLHSYYTK